VSNGYLTLAGWAWPALLPAGVVSMAGGGAGLVVQPVTNSRPVKMLAFTADCEL
jgi:acyl-CoA reductase-like NAD-dependent aldehyde dehydrogenase